MQILRFGDRGPIVVHLQQLLNTWPTRLLPLKCDGDFGKHTQTRVLEFQREKGLPADGLVGRATLAALLRARPENRQAYDTLMGMVSSLATQLPPVSRVSFSNNCRQFLGPLRPVEIPIGGGATASVLVIPWQVVYLSTPAGQLYFALMILLLIIIALLSSSKNPKTREKGIRWQREAERIQSTTGEKTPDVAMAETLQTTKQAARDLIQDKAEALQRCKENNDPPSPSCEKALQEIDRLKREIFEKLQKPNTFTKLIEGIGRNVGELIAAYREASIHCHKCGDLVV